MIQSIKIPLILYYFYHRKQLNKYAHASCVIKLIQQFYNNPY